MTRWKRTLGKWTLRGLALLFIMGAVYVAVLAFPRPLFAHKHSLDEFTIYSNKTEQHEYEQVVNEVRARIASMEHPRPGVGCRIFVCDDQRLYSFFAKLTRRAPNSFAFCLSVFGNIYINEPKVRRMAAQNYGKIRHSRFEGNFAEVIAHEIAHFNVVKELGYRAAIATPFWKSEGYAEYQANVATTQADSAYVFTNRIDLLMNDAFWGRGDSVARRLFEWHVLVEYLADVKGYGLNQLIDESVTEASARKEMLAWYEEQR